MISYLSLSTPTCVYCGQEPVGSDHILPLSLSPLTLYTHFFDHLLFTVSSCSKCNSKLNNKLFLSFSERARHATNHREDILWPAVLHTAKLVDNFITHHSLYPTQATLADATISAGLCLLCLKPLHTNRRQSTVTCPPCLELVRRRERVPR